MNRSILIAGLLLFVAAFLFPPQEYRSYERIFGGAETTLRFIGSGEYLYRGDDMIGSDARIRMDLWWPILGGIAFATFVLARVIGETGNKDKTVGPIREIFNVFKE